MHGLLLINLGTPDAPTTRAVRRYLRQFLSDPYVIDINPIARWLLLNLIILPLRPRKSAAAYRQIWTQEGSPLLVNSQALADNAQQLLGEDYRVALGMRYGKPSIEHALAELNDCETLTILPLFPQYSLAATQTAIARAHRLALKHWDATAIQVINDFYDLPAFQQTQAELIANTFGVDVGDALPVEKILFSYHGIPERQIDKACACKSVCNKRQICPNMGGANRFCYRAQCYATTRGIAKLLGLSSQQFVTTFQSRLGRIPWITPYTDLVLPELAAQGIKKIAIVCPSFVCDCLETLEEIGIRAREQWLALGGTELTLIPCLNDDARWITSLPLGADL